MSQTGIVIVETENGFRWMSVDGNATGQTTSKDSDAVAQQVAEFSRQHRLNKRECVLAVGSSSTLFAAFDIDFATATKDRSAMRYRLESELPIDAENAIADYSFADDRVSATAILKDQWQPFIDAFENQSVEIQLIVPEIVCRVQAAVDANALTPDSMSLWINDHGLDLVLLDRSRISGWRYLPHDQPRLAAEIQFAAAKGASEATKVDAPKIDLRDLRSNQSVEATNQWLAEIPLAVEFYESDSKQGPEQTLARQAGRYLARKSEPWFQLRRDELASYDPWRNHRGEIRRAAVASVLALACLLAGCWWQTVQYNSTASTEDQQVRDVYQRTLPGKRVPVALLTGMRTEKRNLAGIGSASKQVQPPTPAMSVLRGLLTAMPNDIRKEVNQIRIENGRFIIDLDVATIEDAGKIASSLQDAGMLVSPPSTNASKSGRVNARVEGIGISSDPESGDRS